MYHKQLADLLRQERLRRQMTQSQISDLLHISRQTYSSYETCRRSPPPEILAEIFQLLELPMELMFTGLSSSFSQDQQLLRHFHRLSPSSQNAVFRLIRNLQPPEP